MVKPQKVLPELVEGSGFYNLFLPPDIQRKIDHICMKLPDVEWSGTLFYKIKGDFTSSAEDKLEVHVVDFYLQDIGQAAYTEFNQSPDLVSYMCNNPELLEEGVYMGLIHSHNNMATFFSGTDTETLREEGAEKHHFVSLIVNNWHSYTARITRKVTGKREINEEVSYFSFFKEPIKISKTRVVNFEEIEWFTLKINSDTANLSFPEIDQRLLELKREKEKEKEKVQPKLFPLSDFNDWIPANKAKSASKQPANTLFPKVEKKETVKETKSEPLLNLFGDDIGIDYDNIRYDQEIVNSIIRQLITGSVLVSYDKKLDIYKFAKTSVTLFDKRFPYNPDFEIWAEFFVEFLMTEIEDNAIMSELGEDALRAIYAHALITELASLPTNVYIDEYIELLYNYLI